MTAGAAPLAERARAYFADLQDRICDRLTALDGRASFREDAWTYGSTGPGGDPPDRRGGGGRTRVMEAGALFEKAGVNLSAVEGEFTDKLAERLGLRHRRFFATGISLVLHPESPHVPTTHMNLRFLRVEDDAGEPVRSWFGGGADLTPYFLVDEDAAWFHARLREACDRHDPEHYPRFKRACDEYFWLGHRGEARGVGGLFFDYLDRDHENTFAFVRDVGETFLPAYVPIAERRTGAAWSDDERRWQLRRRGRYVEFNLVHDRGTLFGLETGGRTESILMSLPPVVRWDYDVRDVPDDRAAALLDVLRQPREWS